MEWAFAILINSFGTLAHSDAQSVMVERKPCTVVSSRFIRRSCINMLMLLSGFPGFWPDWALDSKCLDNYGKLLDLSPRLRDQYEQHKKGKR